MRMLIMAGGTGGHIIPALAVARELICQGVEISWVGSRHGLEARLVNPGEIDFNPIDIKGLRKSGALRKILMPVMLSRAIGQSLYIFLKRRPHAVLGMGGFVSGPGGLVAAALRLPLILHEQNSVAGLTNRWLSRFSYRTLTGFPKADGIREFEWVGNPVRREIADIPSPARRLSHRHGGLRILVVGGSGGAEVFNQQLPRLLESGSAAPFEVWHQAGRRDFGDIEKAYEDRGICCRVLEFIEDMKAAYEWCDVVICRSGAMTVSEVCSAGVAAIFVPYPHAVNDHQTRNAEYLVQENAAYLVSQEDFLQGSWVRLLAQFGGNRDPLIETADRARRLSRPDAAGQVASICMEAMHA